MTRADIDSLTDSYVMWLRDNILVQAESDGWFSITTPFLDRHNDNFEIYVKEEDGGYLLTDDGHTIRDLRSSGCDVLSGKREKFVSSILNGYGTMLNGDCICVYSNADDFPSKKHNLVQSMQAIDDLYYTSRDHVANLFFYDVSDWLCGAGIPHSSNVLLQGGSFTHHVDFILSERSSKEPRRIIQLVVQPTKSKFADQLLVFQDLQKRQDVELYLLIDDTESKNRVKEFTKASEEYGMNPVSWSKRADFADALKT